MAATNVLGPSHWLPSLKKSDRITNVNKHRHFLSNIGTVPTAVVLLAVSFALVGCAVGPDFKRPVAPSADRYAPTALPESTASAPKAGIIAQHFAYGRDIPAEWWSLFQSPHLNSLVRRAFAANPTLEAAQAVLKQAQEAVYAQQGFFFPTVQTNYAPSRQQLAGNLGGNSPGIQGDGSTISTYANPGGPAPYNGPVIYNFHTAQLTVGYTPDVFGANRRQVESLTAQAQTQRLQLEAAYITLASNVVAAALQEASLRGQIAATQEIIAVNAKSLDIVRHQFRLGYAMRIDVAAQELVLAVAQQLLPPLQKQFQQTRDLIRVLVGNTPDQDVDETFELSALHLPEELPVSLPSKLVLQRPDVRAAAEQLHAASAQVGVAVAARLPQFSISASYGGGASDFSQMFADGGPFWNLVGNITQPIFDGNTLLHRERAADQALVQAGAQYRTTVLTALQNVADTLHALHSDADILIAAVNVEHAAKLTLDLTRKQMELGYINGLVLLTAEQAYQQAILSLVQAQATRFGDTAALFQALGGGWWNRSKDIASAN